LGIAAAGGGGLDIGSITYHCFSLIDVSYLIEALRWALWVTVELQPRP
jgi:hypothetical protein